MLAKIKITPKEGILDPQGKVSHNALSSLGFEGVGDVRVGKYIEVKLDTKDKDKADQDVKQMCTKLFANTVIEDFSYLLEEG